LFFFSSRRRHTRSYGDWSSDVCSSDLRRAPSHEIAAFLTAELTRKLDAAKPFFSATDAALGYAIPTMAEIENLVRRTCASLEQLDRKSIRLNSSHRTISYAVFCLKKKK